jgi:thiamine-phosphate pyrophosphorylase
MIPTQAPILALVIDRAICRLAVPDAVAAACQYGVDWVQIRDQSLADRALVDHAREVVLAARKGAALRGSRCLVVCNRRVDIALAAGCDGVHLGTGALAASDVRALWAEGASEVPTEGAARVRTEGASRVQINLERVTEPLIGISLHDAALCASAASAGADYVHLAPIFEPRSKRGTRQPLGVEALRLAARAGIPVLAQGGVDAQRCAELVAAGAAGVAVTGEILLSDDPGRAAAALRRALDAAPV